MTQQFTLVGRPPTSFEHPHEDGHELLKGFKVSHVASKLEAQGISATLHVNSQLFHLGSATSNSKIGLHFDSQISFLSFVNRPRLLNLVGLYIDGKVSLDGDLGIILRFVNCLDDKRRSALESLSEKARFVLRLSWPFSLTSPNSQRHYGLESGAYRIFLDRYMQYTCGLFDDTDKSIDQAQIDKFKLIADWSQISAGSRHLDIGCGWGGLIHYFAKEFSTNSIGITDTPAQAEFARKEFAANVLIGDFSSLEDLREKFDLITIVGMIEHLSPQQQSNLFSIARRMLTPSGSIYLQCIVKTPNWIGGDGSRILHSYVFPGFFIDTPRNIAMRLSIAGLEIAKFADHSTHYGITTNKWFESVEKNRSIVEGAIGERECRVFLAYLAGASQIFTDGRGGLHRYLLKSKS